MILTSCTPALDMLTMPLVSLSKPVGPVMRQQISDLRSRITSRIHFGTLFLITFSKNYFVILGEVQRWRFPFSLLAQKGRAIRFYSSAQFAKANRTCGVTATIPNAKIY